jgi:hypothetical protein
MGFAERKSGCRSIAYRSPVRKCPAQKICSAKSPGSVQSHKRHHRYYRYGAYFIPPPPAYMPSILPELSGGEVAAVKKPENPYRKYIYSRQGYEIPQPAQRRKGVTVWTASS